MSTFKTLLAYALLVLVSSFLVTAQAEIKTEEINYTIDGESFTGYLAYDDAIEGERPGILVLHEWWGHNEYARTRARMLAELGYTGFALDMYGSGKLAEHPNDAKEFMTEVISDIAKASARFDAAHKLLSNHETVAGEKIAAIGYCMGGGISLNMARSGADLDGVVSFHGSLKAATELAPDTNTKLLVFTGAADPFVPAESVEAFKQEMSAANVDYRLKSYPDVKHSFTNPDADKFGKAFDMPLAYDAAADEDSWKITEEFLSNLF